MWGGNTCPTKVGVCLCLVCSVVLALFVREAPAAARLVAQAATDDCIASRLNLAGRSGRTAARLAGTVMGPFTSFFRRNGLAIAVAVLGFIFLFKIGEAFLGRMSLLFYREIGFNKTDIALYVKGLGWVTTVTFSVMGGYVAVRAGLVRAMFLSGLAMASTNLLFAALAWTGKSAALFAASSGALVDWLDGDWGLFFVITALMVLPSLDCLWAIRRRLANVLAGGEAERRAAADAPHGGAAPPSHHDLPGPP